MGVHAFLGVVTVFPTWIKRRIEKYGFQPDHDFVIDAAPPVRGAGNRGASVEYHISVNMAKELCLVEGNDKGGEYRRYLINIEEKQKALTPLEMIVVQAQAMVALERQQALTNDKADKALELATIAEAKAQASTLQCRDYTILAWANLHGIDLPNSLANMLGRRASALSRSRGVPMGSAPDARWGSVHTYMEHVLEEVFAEYEGD